MTDMPDPMPTDASNPADDPNPVADAPPLTNQQVHTLRTLLHNPPSPKDED
jgi:hypothetical protein